VDSSGCRIRETAKGLEVPVHVQPRARRTELGGVHNGALKLKVSAPPVDDAANRAVVEFFSEMMGIPRSRIQIIAGLKSRDKVLRIAGASLRNLQAFLP
jgi:uncharacterized protein (TIGR00251 family)